MPSEDEIDQVTSVTGVNRQQAITLLHVIFAPAGQNLLKLTLHIEIPRL